MSRIQVDNIFDKEGSGAPSLPAGVVVIGVATATTFSGNFVGNGSGLTGVASTDNIVTSTPSTFADINSTGIITAVSFSGDGSNLVGAGLSAAKVYTFNQLFS